MSEIDWGKLQDNMNDANGWPAEYIMFHLIAFTNQYCVWSHLIAVNRNERKTPDWI